jgi:ADP-ribose pyrophosphatase YjhB (NUDIX family)
MKRIPPPADWLTADDDLTITLPSTTLNIRVGALIVHNDSILVEPSRMLQGKYFLPGGRIKANESSEQALWRELEEECGLQQTSATLWAVIENFFSMQDVSVHELSFYYFVTVPTTGSPWWESIATLTEASAANAPGPNLTWLPLERCSEETMLPASLANRIRTGDKNFRHSIFR